MGHVVRWNPDERLWEVRRGRSKYAPTARAFRRRKDALKFKWLLGSNEAKERRRENRQDRA